MSISPSYLDTVIQGDCLEVMQGLPGACADLVFADPPYFMQTEGFLFRSDGSRFSGVDDAWDKFGGFAEYVAGFQTVALKDTNVGNLSAYAIEVTKDGDG